MWPFGILACHTSVAVSPLSVIFSENLPLYLGMANASINSGISEMIHALPHPMVQTGVASFASVVVIHSLDGH